MQDIAKSLEFVFPSVAHRKNYDMYVSKPIAASEEYYDLGKHTRTFSTENADAQAWFDRGLIWCYALNHEAAVFCVEQVTLHDLSTAMGC